MALAHLRMLIHEFLNKEEDIVPVAEIIIILDRKYDVCMAKNGKDTKHNRKISRRVNFVMNVNNLKTNNIEWCEGDLQLAHTATNNVGYNYLNPRTKYIMVRLEN